MIEIEISSVQLLGAGRNSKFKIQNRPFFFEKSTRLHVKQAFPLLPFAPATASDYVQPGGSILQDGH
jgi:hypothetical protein